MVKFLEVMVTGFIGLLSVAAFIGSVMCLIIGVVLLSEHHYFYGVSAVLAFVLPMSYWIGISAY